AAAQAQRGAAVGVHVLDQLRGLELLIALEVDPLERVDAPGLDAEGELELALGSLLLGRDLDVVVPLLLVVALEAPHGLLHEGLVIACFAEKGQEPLAAQRPLLGADDLEDDLRADLDGVGELDGVGPAVEILRGGIDAGLAVVLADEPLLEAVGGLPRVPATEALAQLELELLDQGRRLERLYRVIETDRLQDGAGAAAHLVGDHGPPAQVVGVDRDANPGFEIAVGLEKVLEREDAP